MAKYLNKEVSGLIGHSEGLTVSYTYTDEEGKEHGMVSTYESDEKLLEEWEPILEDGADE